MPIETPQPSSSRRKFLPRWPATTIGLGLVVGLLALIAVSSLPMRGAELFGGLVNKIKGNPRATVFWIFSGLGVLWAAIATLTGVQEWRAAQRMK